MDEFIRQAYADGMLNDDSHIAPDPSDDHHHSSPPYNTNQQSTNTNRIPAHIDEPEEVILLLDDDDDDNERFAQINTSEPLSTSYQQTSHHSSPPRSPIRPTIITVSLPYTYLSLIRHETFSSNINHQDYTIKGCFSSLVSNPRLIKNEFDLEAYLNDGSDCLRVRLAPDLLAQRIGITVTELMNKRKECKNDSDKQKFQSDFNERLKKFGHAMGRLYTIMTIRFYSGDQVPMVTQIDES
jgi:hypothetical protein